MNNDNKPTLKGEIKKARASNYNFTRAINEFIDNSLDTDATNIFIELNNSHNKPYSVKISDNSTQGIPENKLSNLFSWTYERERNETDIGKFGTGFKSASVNIGDKLIVYTYDKNNNKYLKCIADWNTMSENNNWVPEQINTTIDDYKSKSIHPFEHGSSFIIEQILHDRHPQFKKENIYEIANIYKYILYSKLNLQIIIKLNNELLNLRNFVHYNFNNSKLILENNIDIYQINDPEIDDNIIAVITESKTFVKYIKPQKNGNYICKEIDYKHNKNNKLLGKIIFKSCYDYSFVDKDDDYPFSFPYGSVDVIRFDRIVGANITNYSASRTDGYANYIKHEIIYNSTSLDDYLGISFNKSNDGHIPDNNIKYVINYIIKKNLNAIVKSVKSTLPESPTQIIPPKKQDQPTPIITSAQTEKQEQPKQILKPIQSKKQEEPIQIITPIQTEKQEQPTQILKPVQSKKQEEPMPIITPIQTEIFEQHKKQEQPKKILNHIQPKQADPLNNIPEKQEHTDQNIVNIINISNIICTYIENTINIYDIETKRNIYFLIIDNFKKLGM
jgi:hypothetical protein